LPQVIATRDEIAIELQRWQSRTVRPPGRRRRRQDALSGDLERAPLRKIALISNWDRCASSLTQAPVNDVRIDDTRSSSLSRSRACHRLARMRAR
jgi:hypothetical protein